MKLKRILVSLVLLTILIVTNCVESKAAELPCPLDIDVKQNKSEYHEGDKIEYTIKIKNSSQSVGNHLITNISLPDNVKTSDATEYQEKTINIGQEYTYTITGEIVGDHINVSQNDNNSKDVFAGDTTNAWIVFVILILVSALIIFIVIKKKKRIRIYSLFFVLLLGMTSLFYMDVKAEEGSQNSRNEFNHVTIINGKEYNLKVSCAADFGSQGDTELIINNELDENNQMMISSESAVITGSVRDKDGIKEISYEIDDLDGNVQSNPIDNVENWSFEEDFNIGTSKITITAIDNLNNETQKVFSIVRVNDKIIVQDNVDLFDESESQSFFNGIYEVFEAGMGTEDLSDDGIVVIIARNNEIVPKLTLDNIVYIAPGSAFPAGFTGKVNAIMAPSEIELGDNYLGLESGMTEYSDEEFIAVKFVTPSYDEVIAEDICLKSEGEVDFDQDLVFAFGPNGENLLEESEVTPYSFFKGAKPKISYEEGELEIGFDDVILYDKDNDLETKNDQIRIDGNVNLSNMKYNGGIEVAKWDINPLPKQAGVNFTYDLDESLSIYWESIHSTEDIIEKINQGRSGFKNKVSLGSLFSVEGVNTNKEIYLATFGVGMFTGTGSAELGVGYMGNYAVRSLAQPIILINVVLCVNGELKLKIAGSMTKSSKESIGVTAVRKGFLESFVDKNSFTQRILGNHVLANYNIKTVGDSKNRNTKVELDASGTAEGHLGYGINGSMMYLGIIPISGTLSNQIDCELEGKLGFVKENKNAASFEIEGKYTLGMSAYVEPQIKYALSVEKTGFEAGISYYDKLKLFEFFKIEKEKNNATKLKGYLYTDETEKTLVTRNNLLIEMKGDNAFEYESDVKNGVFSLDKIMSGKYTVNLMDAKTHQNIASQEVEIIRNKDNIVKFYIKDIPPEQKYETLILNPGDSYRLTCKKGDSLYVRAKKDTVYDYYCPASTAAEYQEDFAQGSEFYVPQNENEFVELKVNSGEMEVFVLQNGGVDQKPDKNLSESYTITNLNGSELFHVFEVNAGETFTIDFPVDGTKADSRTIWGFPEKGLSYEYEYDIIDYYWNKNFGWEITTETYSYDGDTGFWFALSNYEKRVFRVTRGTLILLYHRNDTDLTVY